MIQQDIKIGSRVIMPKCKHEALIVKESSFYRILDLNTCRLHGTIFVTLKELKEELQRL